MTIYTKLFTPSRIFSLHHERVVARDNTIQFANHVLDVPPTRFRATLSGCRVTVYEHLNGTLSIGYGPHTVARFRSTGEPLTDPVDAIARFKRNGEKKLARKKKGANFFLNKVTSAARSAPR